MTKSTISAVLITYNEEKLLAQCLTSIKSAVDEIIILDSGSTDETINIGKSFGATIVIDKNWEGFGKRRQQAKSFAKSDYVIKIDPDETVDEKLLESIKAVRLNPVKTNQVFLFKRIDFFCNREIYPKNWYADKQIRLYPRKSFSHNDKLVHEGIEAPNATHRTLKGFLHHHTSENFIYYLLKQTSYSKAWASGAQKKNKSSNIGKALIKGLASFIREYLIRGTCIKGVYGFIFAVSHAQYAFNKYMILDLQKTEVIKAET
jgi:(heptosyl)LPS beta-1,4-glucosyltransferase